MFWVLDNASSHADKTSIARMQDAWPNARLIDLPVHASWLNQIEIYFSILQRKGADTQRFRRPRRARRPNLRFEAHYRQVAEPFQWTFTRAKLDALLARPAAREPHLRLAA